MAGVPWEKDTAPAKVFYSKEILAKFTNGQGEPFYKGWNFERAVEHAHKTGRRGHVEYIFKRVPRLPYLLRAFKDQSDYLEQGEGFAHDVVRDLVAQIPELEPDVAALRMACVYLKLRSQFMDIWKYQIPIMIVPNPGRTRHGRGIINTKHGTREAMVVETPGFRMVSLNASEKTRKHLGL